METAALRVKWAQRSPPARRGGCGAQTPAGALIAPLIYLLDKERIHPSCVLEIGHAELTDGLEVAVRERWIPSIIIF